MKVIQTPIRFYPAIGGVEKYVLDISKKLGNHDIQIKVICANNPRSNLKEYQGVEIKRLAYQFKIANTNICLGLPFSLFREKFDLIHTHLPTPWTADWSVLIAKIKRKPVVLTYHNDVIGKGLAGLVAKLYCLTLLKLTLYLSDQIIITQAKYFKYSAYLKKYEKKIKVIPNSVDLEEFKKLPIKKEPNSLFFLSVLDEYHKYKGLDDLLKAVQLVKKEIPDVKLVIGGQGSFIEYYKNLVHILDIQSNVEFHGFIEQKKLVEYYNRYQAFVLPSRDSNQEGFGIVLLEALACGQPVITTNIVGIAKDISQNNCGIVIKPRSILELKSSIAKVLKNEDLRKIQERKALRLAARYNLRKNAVIIKNLYQNLISNE